MARVSADLLRLAADMLDAYADELTNNYCCNDWSPPNWMSVEDVARLQRIAWEGNGRQADESPDAPVRADFVAALAVARYLRLDLLADLADAEARAERSEAAIAEALMVTAGMHDQPRATIALALAEARTALRTALTATRRGKDGDHG